MSSSSSRSKWSTPTATGSSSRTSREPSAARSRRCSAATTPSPRRARSTPCSALRRPGSRPRSASSQLNARDPLPLDRESGEVTARRGKDQVGLPLPEADVLDVGARRARGRRRVRVKDGELVAFVLEDPRLGVGLQLEAVRRRRGVATRDVPLRDAVAQEDEAARLVRELGLRMLDERLPDLAGNYHQTVRSIDVSTSSESQKSAERYFHPASGSTQTTTPASRSAASLRATCTTAPEETPAKIPLSSRRRRSASDEG